MNPKRIERLIKLSLKPAITLLIVASVSLVGAQTFTTLHSFTALSPNLTNSDGASPQAGMISSGNTLYGAAVGGGQFGNGTVFAVNTDGTGFTNLHSFTVTSYPHSPYTNSDGVNPFAELILSSNTLYGTAYEGGRSGAGTVFAVNTDGTGFTNLHSFTALSGYINTDGAIPYAGLILSGNILYGAANQGGSSGSGTVFAINTDGTGFTNLHSFTALSSLTNSDGGNPFARLILSGNTLYGTASGGGSSIYSDTGLGAGTVFAVNTDGTGFTNLHSFNGGSDGAYPYAGLTLSGDILYGTAERGGSSKVGTVFKVNTNGMEFTTLHSFTAPSGSNYTNSDGAVPQGRLILSGKTLYGTTLYGGSSGFGTVFAINTDGTGFTTLHSFTSGGDGASPYAGLILLGNMLYGTTEYGGTNGDGTVFRLLLPPVVPPMLALQFIAGYPQLNLYGTLSNNYIVQYSTNLTTTNWINLFSVTNLSASPYQFFDPAGVAPSARFYRAVQLQ
jgi:uncharacterized repeat protein (TIGR03803 family)